MRRAAALALLLLSPTAAQAQSAGGCEPGQATRLLDAGNVRARLNNTGGLFYRHAGGFAGGLYNVPKAPLGQSDLPNAVYSASFMLGGKVGGEVRLAAADYKSFEFFPGPLLPGPPPLSCAAYDRIYRVSTADVEAYRSGSPAPADLRDWPVGLGAPAYHDANGNGRFDRGAEPVVTATDRAQRINLAGGERPLMSGDEMAWWVMNDAGGYHATTGSRPLGVEVQVTAFAYNRPGHLGNATFYRYRIVNRTAAPITDAYAGFWSNFDIGLGNDDHVGTDSALDLAYAYNADNMDQGVGNYGDAPPAAGVLLPSGPLVDAPGLSWRDPDGRTYPNRRRLGMTSAMTYYNNPGGNGNPSMFTTDWYAYLRGLWRDGSPMRACGTGYAGNGFKPARADCPVTRFVFSGDPATGQGWSARNLYPGGQTDMLAGNDVLLLSSTGPFVLAPDQPQEVTFALLWARGTDYLDAVDRLKGAVPSVKSVFSSAYTAAETAPAVAPALVIDALAPNPASGTAMATVQLGRPGALSVTVRDLLGREVARLDAGPRGSGPHQIALPVQGLAPGVYAVRIALGDHGAGRMLVIR